MKSKNSWQNDKLLKITRDTQRISLLPCALSHLSDDEQDSKRKIAEVFFPILVRALVYGFHCLVIWFWFKNFNVLYETVSCQIQPNHTYYIRESLWMKARQFGANSSPPKPLRHDKFWGDWDCKKTFEALTAMQQEKGASTLNLCLKMHFAVPHNVSFHCSHHPADAHNVGWAFIVATSTQNVSSVQPNFTASL